MLKLSIKSFLLEIVPFLLSFKLYYSPILVFISRRMGSLHTDLNCIQPSTLGSAHCTIALRGLSFLLSLYFLGFGANNGPCSLHHTIIPHGKI